MTDDGLDFSLFQVTIQAASKKRSRTRTSHIHSVGFALQTLGFKILNDIAWQKTNPPPNLSCRYFTHATETILWARRGEKARHKFNYQEMKRANGGKQMQSLW